MSPAKMWSRYQRTIPNKPSLLWGRFDSLRTKETGGDYRPFLTNFASLTIPPPCTHRDAVEAIARQSQKPFAIQSLADVLRRTRLIRGTTIFSLAANEIDNIANNYDDMYWWISRDGLNMTVVPPAAAKLSKFDEFAGKLYADMSKDGTLSKEILLAIAKEVDIAGFALKKQLQPAQWKPISKHNQMNPRRPIKTFEQACRYPKYVRSVRKRLYVARERYVKADFPVPPLPKVP